LDGAKMTSIGYGPEKPIASNNTEAGRQRNRRVEFAIK
jgi:outer membrane protein OmpA-like peptidoglycan-associated protein